MARVFLFSLVIGFFAGYAARSFAAETVASRSVSRTPPPASAYSLAAVANSGPSSLDDGNAPDLETRGNFRQILAMLNRAAPRWNFAAGLGFFSSELTGNSTQGEGPGSGLRLATYSRETSGEIARASARYRITDRLEAGLSADLLFGTDVGFGSSVFEGETSSAWLAGTELLYGIDLLGLRLKLGARYFASLGLSSRTLAGIQGVLEAGFPVF